MHKDNCIDLTKLILSAWNKFFNNSTIRHQAKAYWGLIRDLDYDDVYEVITKKMATDKEVPSPFDLRLAVIGDTLPDGMPPTPTQAWAQLKNRARNSETGVPNENPHPVLAKTMESLGDTALGLSTNSDRTWFMDEYRTWLGKYLLKYAPVNQDAQD